LLDHLDKLNRSYAEALFAAYTFIFAGLLLMNTVYQRRCR
jgi:hypothetical protein